MPRGYSKKTGVPCTLGRVVGNKKKIFKTRAQFYLKDGSFFIVDVDDVAIVSRYTWSISGSNAGYRGRTKNNHYIGSVGWDSATKKSKKTRLHRFLMGARDGEYVDHIDGNFRNNRRSNLRFASSSQNSLNRRTRNNGISWRAKTQKYEIKLTIDGKEKYFGSFKTKEEAEARVVELKNKYYGEFSPHWPGSRQ